MRSFLFKILPFVCAATTPLCVGAKEGNATGDQKMMGSEITPSAQPSVSRWADPYVTADFIWWRAQEDGLEYAFNGTGQGFGFSNADKGRFHHPHFKYEPGFKVGFGLKFRHDGWDLFTQYTWLRPEGHNKVLFDHDGDSNVQSNIFLPINGNLESFWAEEAKAQWSLDFNVLDVELGRNFWISRHLTLRPHFGMKFSRFEQEFRVEYEEVELEAELPDSGVRDVKMKMDLDQSAIGLRTGLDAAFYMWKKWSIFGEFAISGMWNDFDSHRKDILKNFNGGKVTLNHVDRDSHSVTAVIEWALGLRFEHAFHNDDFLFLLQAGWEEQVWLNQNQFVMMPNATPADLNLEGLTVKAGFFF